MGIERIADCGLRIADLLRIGILRILMDVFVLVDVYVLAGVYVLVNVLVAVVGTLIGPLNNPTS